MSNYSNFVGYVPDKLRLQTTGGSLVEGELGLPNEYVAGLAIGPVSSGAPVSAPGISLSAGATFTLESGASYINFQNLVATTNAITVTGQSEGGGTDFEASFGSLEYVGNQITGRSDRLKKLNLPALKRIDSLDNGGRIALYYSGGHDVTGEVYTPNLKQAAGLGVSVNYGSGGLANIDNTFSSYVSGSVVISGYTGADVDSATVTPAVDFLSGMKAGNVYFQAASNWEEIKIAQNNSGIGNSQTYTVVGHANTTGIYVPRMANNSATISITPSPSSTGDLTINFTGTPIDTTGEPRFFNNINLSALNKDLNIINDHVHLTRYTVSTSTSTPFGVISIQSSGNLNVSGGCLTGITTNHSEYSTNGPFFILLKANNNLNVSTTGAVLNGWATGPFPGVNYKNESPAIRFNSVSGNINVNCPNLTQSTIQYLFNPSASGATVTANFPELTGSPDDSEKPSYASGLSVLKLTIAPSGATAVDTTQVLNIPKLHNISGSITVQGLSGSTTTISGADLTYVSGSINVYTSGNATYTFTGGPGSGSGITIGTIDNRVYLSGNTITGDFGTLSSGRAIIISGAGTAVDSSITINATGLHQLSGNTVIHGLSGSVVTFNAADLTHLSGSLTARTSGNINFTFTGGPGSGSGTITNGIAVQTYLSGSTISGDFGSLTTISGNLNVISSGNTDLQLTGLNSIVSGVFITGFVNNININGNLIPGTTTVVDSVSGTISITGGHTGPATGVMSSNFLVTGRTSSAVITGIFNGIQTISGDLRVTSSGNTDLQLTGLNRIVSGVFVTGFTNTININSSLVPGTTAVVDAVSGAISITGGHTGPATGVMSSNFLVTGRTSSSVITGIFNGIQTISGNLNIISSGNTNVQLTGLTEIVSGVSIQSRAAATFTHPLDNNSSLTAISTVYTGYVAYYYPIIISGDSITGASASALTQVGNIAGQAGVYGGYVVSTGITNFSMPNITGWHTQTEFDLPNVTGFNMSGLVFLGGTGVYAGGGLNGRVWQGFWLKLGSTLTGNLDFSNLTDIHYYSNNNYAGYGYFPVKPMRIEVTGITSIDMSAIVSGVYKPAWRGVDSVLIPSETSTTEFTSPALTGLTFGASGTTQRLLMSFNASGCPLNEASVDQILQTFASLDGTAGTSTYSGLTITLNGLCAPPSATGSGYRDTLTGAGRNCTVLINT